MRQTEPHEIVREVLPYDRTVRNCRYENGNGFGEKSRHTDPGQYVPPKLVSCLSLQAFRSVK